MLSKLTELVVVTLFIHTHSSNLISSCCRKIHSKLTPKRQIHGALPHHVPSRSVPEHDRNRSRDEAPTEPIHVDHGKYHSECSDIMGVLPVFSMNQQSLGMQQVCESRFDELHAMHQHHQHLLHDQEPVHPASTVHARSHLVVLDLDETVMDQDSFAVSEAMHSTAIKGEYWKNVNLKELILNINQIERRWRVQNERRVWIGFFRKYIMEFVAFTLSNNDSIHYDLVLYSLANRDAVIYQAVTMEMYYNFVFTPNQKRNQRFIFKSVISRDDACAMTQKSVETLMKLLGTNGSLLREYENVIILDDQGPHIWSDRIPDAMIANDVSFLCLVPSQFTFGGTLRMQYKIVMTDYHFPDFLNIRERDTTFLFLEQILRTPPENAYVQTKLVWNIIC